MYVCGPTVYSDVHLGNCRTFMSFDMMYRFLLYLGYKVRYVHDGEDRISKGSRLENLEPMEIVQKYTNGFHDMMDVFNCLRPSIEPKATGHIVEQIQMVQAILDNGLAYEINGSVYFDTVKFASSSDEYGQLSGRKIEELIAESRSDLKNQDEKRHPSDFAIWIKASDEHIMKWPSPWSIGFPGWHLECSVMSTKYLGNHFDIHGGGNDLKFPHHENEIAQNFGACDCAPANYWLHTNMLLLNGKKMSKSDGNNISPEELFSGESMHVKKGYSPMAVRFFGLQAHYGSPLDMTDSGMLAAEKGLKKLMAANTVLQSLITTATTGSQDAELHKQMDAVIAEMCDDFNTPKALARMFEIVPKINSWHEGLTSLDEVSKDTLNKLMKLFNDMIFEVFGLKDEDQGSNHNELDQVMQLVIDIRAQSRADKNWAISDQIRDHLAAANIQLKDGKDGTTWSKN
ncbi:UNVERIFIED_CONTAM: hypothetical protein GTU68_029852 [Idotea baltica]|nr:hypothetical protein [Idotea baltica]